MKRPVLVAIIAVVAAASAVGGYMYWRAQARVAAVREGVPARPDLSAWPAELASRIDACTRRVESGGDDAVRALGELGQLYHANGFYAEASVCYHALLRADPANARWPHAFASILAGYGKVDDAIVLFRQAADLAPGYVPSRLRLGDVLLKANRLDEAAKVYREILQIEPRQAYAHLGLGRILMAQGDWTGARDALERAASLSNDRLAYDLLPTVYERLLDTERAATLRGRIKAAGSYADAPDPWLDEMMLACYDTYRLAVAGGAAKHGGDRKVALQLLERARQISPDSAPVHFQLGIMFLETKEYSKARPHLEQCTRLAPDMADGWIHLSNLHATVGNRAESERVLAEGLARCPQSPGLQLEKAHRLAAAGRTDEAIAAYHESFRLRPDEAAPLFSVAKIHFEQGRDAEGIAELERALQAEPGFPPALSILAYHAITTGDQAGARLWLERVRQQPRVTRSERDQLVKAFTDRFGSPP